MARCNCASQSCACRIDAGPGVTVTGIGSSQDPFIVSSDLGFTVADSTIFDLTLSGAGTSNDPYLLQVGWAEGMRLDDIPDVDAPTPTNGYVLGWDSAAGRWRPQAPTTAAAGSVTHDATLTGDGSAGSPLSVQTDTARYVGETDAGVGLTNEGMNSVVRRFATTLNRTNSTISPTLNALTMLDANPGVLEYWTGTVWEQVLGIFRLSVPTGQQLLSTSGTFDGRRMVFMVRQVTFTTDTDGVFTALTPEDLSGAAGVVLAVLQETGSIPYKATLYGAADRVNGTAYRLDTGGVYGNQALTGTVLALVY